MSNGATKAERLAEFYQRLKDAKPVDTFDDAYSLLCSTLNEVEDELSGVPNAPEQWKTLDRLFPPQFDRMSSVAGCGVKRFDSVSHITYIAPNGAIEVRRKTGRSVPIEVNFSKAGSDRKGVNDICPSLSDKNL